MVRLLLFLILLVVAWPVFAFFGDALPGVIGNNLHIIVPIILISVAYLSFLAPIAKKNNIELAGRWASLWTLPSQSNRSFKDCRREKRLIPLIA